MAKLGMPGNGGCGGHARENEGAETKTAGPPVSEARARARALAGCARIWAETEREWAEGNGFRPKAKSGILNTFFDLEKY